MIRPIRFLIFTCISISAFELKAQCTPVAADLCNESNVLCSLTELNGYTCKNADYSSPSICSSLCPYLGARTNSSWWAFVTAGGEVCLTITFSNCYINGNGVQYGIWGDCSCKDSIYCDPSCNGPGVKKFCGKLEACKTYYLFVNGCKGDVCDFTISTSGGSEPRLPPLENIVGPTTICKSSCKISYSSIVGNGACKPSFQWTLDGTELDQYTKDIKLGFPDEGDFVLCVSAIIGNIQSGSVCDQIGPKCITIKVRQEIDLKAGPRFICFENAPFSWYGQTIGSSGEYFQHFTDKNCCEYDSIVTFVVLEKPDPPNVYFLGCPGEIYKDPTTGKPFSTCQDGIEVVLPKFTKTYKCDSTYKIYAVFLNGTGRMREYSELDNLIIEVTPIDGTCSVIGYKTESYSYRWYQKSSPNKTLGINSKLNIVKKDEYCCDITFVGSLDKLKKQCIFSVCEQYDESQYLFIKYDVIGKQEFCSSDSLCSWYNISPLPVNSIENEWTLSNGKIVDTMDSYKLKILWNFSNSNAGELCFRYRTQAGWSNLQCKKIVIGETYAGSDNKVIGLNYKMQANSGSVGEWSVVNGSNLATFSNKFDPKSTVRVKKNGKYLFRWTSTCSNTIFFDDVEIEFNRFGAGSKEGGTSGDTCCSGFHTANPQTRSTLQGLTYYPNPVKSRLLILDGGSISSKCSVSILNLQGRTFLEKEFVWIQSNFDLYLPDHIPMGIYLIQIRSSYNNQIIGKLIID